MIYALIAQYLIGAMLMNTFLAELHSFVPSRRSPVKCLVVSALWPIATVYAYAAAVVRRK